MKILTPEEIIDSFKSALGDNLLDSSIYQTEVAVKKNLFTSISLHVKRETFRDAVKHICDLQEYPHLIVISSGDRGDVIELIYHITIYYGQHLKEISLLLGVSLPKNDLKIPTITDIIPGAIYAERETQEMMGVEVTGIPDKRRLFLPDEFPEGVYPWRQDETGPEEMLRVLPGRKGIQHG
jgi:membrane-bound hydrogenase subunit beta